LRNLGRLGKKKISKKAKVAPILEKKVRKEQIQEHCREKKKPTGFLI